MKLKLWEVGVSGSVLGILAAIFQISVTCFISNFSKRSIRPNAASYLMFTARRSLLALAWQNEAVLPELLAVRLRRNGEHHRCLAVPQEERDRACRTGSEAIIFSADLWLYDRFGDGLRSG
ncbi:MAG: hypothetical protein IPP45_14435 [Sphingomonadales bacterium]|nr:hypothetical protein [Sphingomonadales bacterium]